MPFAPGLSKGSRHPPLALSLSKGSRRPPFALSYRRARATASFDRLRTICRVPQPEQRERY